MNTKVVAEIFRDTEVGRALHQEGREEGRVELLSDLLRDRFGDHPNIPAVAHRLATGPNATTAVHAISTAATLEDLLTAQPGS
jgi:hypothetical protein